MINKIYTKNISSLHSFVYYLYNEILIQNVLFRHTSTFKCKDALVTAKRTAVKIFLLHESTILIVLDSLYERMENLHMHICLHIYIYTHIHICLYIFVSMYPYVVEQ